MIAMLCALVIMLAMGCALTDPQYRQEKPAKSAQRMNLNLQPGEWIEAVIVEPARTVKQRRVRAQIDDAGLVAFDTLGRFNTRGRSLSQLEQDMLTHLNQGRRLQGTLRLSVVDTSIALPSAD